MPNDERLGGETGASDLGGSEDIARDELFRALADTTRRHTLAYLRDAGRPVPVPELAEHVAAATSQGDAADVRDAVDVATSLHHVHVPQLTTLGLVEWVDDRRAVACTDRCEALPAAIPWRPSDGPASE